VAAWLAFLALLVPFVHICGSSLIGEGKPARRSRFTRWLYKRNLAGQRLWLGLHMAAAFFSFVMVLVHSRGHASGVVTRAMLLLFWGVMLSGVIGYWGRILIYRLLRVALDEEFGRADREKKEKPRLHRRAKRLLHESWKLTEYDIGNWQSFCRDLQDKHWLQTSLWDTIEQRRGQPGYLAKEIGRLTVRRAVQARPLPARMNPLIGLLNDVLDDSKLCTKDAFAVAAKRPGLSDREMKRCQRLQSAAELVFAREDALKPLSDQLKNKKTPLQQARESVLELCKQVLLSAENSQTPPGETPHGGHLSALEVKKRQEVLGVISERLVKMESSSSGGTEPLASLYTEEEIEAVTALHNEEIQRHNRLYIELWSEEVGESRPPDSAIEAFFEEEVKLVLEAPDPSWTWLFTRQACEPIWANRVEALRMLVGPGQTRIVDGLMNWVERRRQLDVEFWLDRLANSWLKVHGWMAWALLLLVLDHVIGFCYRGGWWPR